MEDALLAGDSFLRGVFDAIPVHLFIVDHDVRIMHLNAAVRDDLGLDLEKVHRMRAGKVLHCVNEPQAAAGCGRSAACDDCVIRIAVANAIQGSRTRRKEVCMESEAGGVKKTLKFQVTASPFQYREKPFVLLVLEPSAN